MRRSGFLALALAAPAPVHVVALGDSLAFGTGATRPDRGFIFQAFRELVARRPGSTLDTYAIGGSTVADVLRLQVARLAGSGADVVVLCVGGNDVLRETPPATFAARYRTLVARVRRAAPRAHVVCCGVPDLALSPIFSGDRAAVRARSASDDAAVRAAARNAGARFVDLYGLTKDRSDADRFLSGDRFHPSDAGYTLLAGALAPTLLAASGG